MSLTRYLPLPSDRMGILWSLLSVDGSIVVEYGPAGTTHFSMSLYGELGVDHENRLFTTHMSEEDVIMGDVSRLEQAIAEVDEAYEPKVIFVVASSITAVIGTDLKGVCNYMQDKVRARLIGLEQGGFRGDYSAGLAAAYRMLAEEFPEQGIRTPDPTYNLLGVSQGSYRAKSDVWELQELLFQAYGWRQKACYCCDTSVEQLRESGGAWVNLVLRGEAAGAAQIMEKTCGIPWIQGVPYGYRGTMEWLESLEASAGRKPDSGLMETLREKSMEASMYQAYGRMLKEDKPVAALVGEYHTITGLAGFLEDMGITVGLKLCLHSLKGMEHPDPEVLHAKTEKEKIALVEGLHKHLIMADDVTLRLCAKDNTCLRISAPVVNGAQVANHRPIAGLRGADEIMETVEYYFQMLH